MLVNIERKIAGINIIWITLLISAGFILTGLTGGDLINWAYLGFEVLMPFHVTIMVCECVSTLSDPLIDVIIVHAKSLFFWVIRRFLVIFSMIGILCILCMIVLNIAVLNFSIGEVVSGFLSTTFFLSSLGVFASFLSRRPHASTALCGTMWIFGLLIKSLVRFPVIAHIYPFIRFVDADNPIWIVNKAILVFIGIGMWFKVFRICQRRQLFS